VSWRNGEADLVIGLAHDLDVDDRGALRLVPKSFLVRRIGFMTEMAATVLLPGGRGPHGAARSGFGHPLEEHRYPIIQPFSGKLLEVARPVSGLSASAAYQIVRGNGGAERDRTVDLLNAIQHTVTSRRFPIVTMIYPTP
jgi:hypothetical protein